VPVNGIDITLYRVQPVISRLEKLTAALRSYSPSIAASCVAGVGETGAGDRQNDGDRACVWRSRNREWRSGAGVSGQMAEPAGASAAVALGDAGD
jgi:hypothetical protein